jgi:hypothetical protein
MSVTIVAFAEQNEWPQIYGLMLMPVAVAFCGYSLYVYIKRAVMIRLKDPGPYEDRVGHSYYKNLKVIVELPKRKGNLPLHNISNDDCFLSYHRSCEKLLGISQVRFMRVL